MNLSSNESAVRKRTYRQRKEAKSFGLLSFKSFSLLHSRHCAGTLLWTFGRTMRFLRSPSFSSWTSKMLRKWESVARWAAWCPAISQMAPDKPAQDCKRLSRQHQCIQHSSVVCLEELSKYYPARQVYSFGEQDLRWNSNCEATRQHISHSVSLDASCASGWDRDSASLWQYLLAWSENSRTTPNGQQESFKVLRILG